MLLVGAARFAKLAINDRPARIAATLIDALKLFDFNVACCRAIEAMDGYFLGHISAAVRPALRFNRREYSGTDATLAPIYRANGDAK